MNNMVYMAYDGDNAGRLVGRSILANDANGLHEISNRITLGHELVKRWVEAHGGQFISGGGDEGVFCLPIDAVHQLEELRADYNFATNLTVTIGIGQNLAEAGKSLMVGKFRGKNTVVTYDPSIEQEIQASQTRVGAGQGSDEEKKIGEAYLNPQGQQAAQDPAAAAQQGVGDAPQGEIAPEAQAQQQEPAPEQIPNTKETKDQEEAIGQSNKMVEGQNMSTPRENVQDSQTNEADFTDPNKSVVDPQRPNAEESINNPDALPPGEEAQASSEEKVDMNKPNAQEAQNEKNKEGAQGAPAQGQEGVAAIKEGIDNPQSQAQEKDIMDNIDDTQLATGQEMEGNVSRPDGFNQQNIPGDTGLNDQNAVSAPPQGNPADEADPSQSLAPPEGTPEGAAEEGADPEGQEQIPGEEGELPPEGEESPDIAGVLKDGLDEHANDQQKEVVCQAIGEALAGFKGNKHILERAKEKAPELYTSSLAMLRAMIEMAKMLGIGGDQESAAIDEIFDAQPGEGQPGEGGPEQKLDEADGGFPPKKGEEAEGKEKPEGKDKGVPPKKDDKEKSEGKDKGAPKKEEKPKKEDKSAAPKEGSAKDAPKGSAPIGTSIGKLPTKHTTEHVARTPLAPGSINVKGQQKVIDPATGKTRWIDRKEGSVLGGSGVPIKNPEPQRKNK